MTKLNEAAKIYARKTEGFYKDGSPVAHELVDAFKFGWTQGREDLLKVAGEKAFSCHCESVDCDLGYIIEMADLEDYCKEDK